MNFHAKWDDMSPAKKTSTLRSLSDAGLRPGEISNRLFATRNQIVGYAHRNSIKLCVRAHKPVAKGRLATKLPKARECVPHAWDALMDSRPVAFLQVGENQCRWPLGEAEDRMCCGAHVRRGSYCQAHLVLASGEGDGRKLSRNIKTVRNSESRESDDADIMGIVRIKPRTPKLETEE